MTDAPGQIGWILPLALSVIPLAAGYALVATGFWINFSVGRFFDLSLGLAFLVGGYGTYALAQTFSMPVAIVAGTLLAAGAGWFVGIAVVRPLIGRVEPLPLFVATLAIVWCTEGVIAAWLGPQARVLHLASDVTTYLSLSVGELSLIVLSTVALVGVGIMVRYSSWGRQVRIFADDPELAMLYGFDQRTVFHRSYAVAGCLAGMAGAFHVANRVIEPTSAMAILLVAMVATLLGGSGVGGVIVGAVTLATVETSLGFLASGAWKQTGAFAVLVAILATRGGGLMAAVDRRF